jgi:hypothetical protein
MGGGKKEGRGEKQEDGKRLNVEGEEKGTDKLCVFKLF